MDTKRGGAGCGIAVDDCIQVISRVYVLDAFLRRRRASMPRISQFALGCSQRRENGQYGQDDAAFDVMRHPPLPSLTAELCRPAALLVRQPGYLPPAR